MKKVFVFLLTIILGLGTLSVSAQQTVEIGSGTSSSSYLPSYSFYNYSLTQQLYTPEEIGTGGTITSIAFYNAGSEKTRNYTVYMINTDKTSFANATDWITVSATDVVFSGDVTFAANVWTTITLTTPFDYDGASNLAIIVDDNTGSYSSGLNCYVFDASSMALRVYSDGTNYDPFNPGSYSGTVMNVKNQLHMEIMPSGNNCYGPLSPVVSDISAYEATLSWTPRDDQEAWEVYCGTGVIDLEQVDWTSVTDTFFTFTDLTPASNHTAYVRTVCDADVSNPRQVPFTTEATCASVPSNVMVNNITATTVDVNWTAGEDDYAWEVVAVPSNMTPESGTIEQTSTHPYTITDLQDNTQYSVYVRTDCGNGDHSYWSNAATFTTQPFCSSPLNVTISQITANSALVSWEPAVFGANDYTVEYSLANDEDWTVEVVDGTQLMLSGLEPDSTYTVRIYSNCDIGTGDTIYKSFITRHCLVGGDLQIGEGTSTISYYPTNSCYNYSYTQQIFLSSEMNGPANINSIAFDASSIASSSRHISIYMMNTTAASSDWLTTTTAQLVFNGTVNLVVGWNTFDFTAPFQYNGTDNLALIIIDSTGSYSCSNYYHCHTASATLSHCQYQDSGPYSINSIPSSGNSSTSSTRCNVIFGGDCDEDATCVRPNVYVTETSENSVTLDWAPGYTESAWDVEYSADNINWEAAGTVNTHPYEVTNLNADTRYYFRVRSNCDGEESDWSGASARTECGPITQLPYINNFDEVIMDNGTAFITCWSRYTTNPARVVRCYGSATHSGSYALDFNYSPSCTTAAVTPMLDSSIPLNTVMLDFWAYSSLGQGWMEVGTMSDPNDFSTYEFYDTVRLNAPNTWENLMISFENYSGNNQYIAFLEINGTTTSYIFDDFTIDYIPTCMHPTNLAVDGLTGTTVTLSWDEIGDASMWNIEYGPTGFVPGEGTIATAYENPFTVEDLTPAVTYDFYVYADCGGILSDPFGPVSATPGQYIMTATGSDTVTTCGLIIYDNGGPTGNYTNSCNSTLVLYPAEPGSMMMLIGTCNTESNWDYLKIYDGVGTSGTELINYSGSHNVTAISTTGPLTIVFTSDGSTTYSGFQLLAECVSCFPPTNVIASDPTIDGATITWSGVGDSYVLFLNGDMTTGYDADDTTYTFTGLEASSLYSVQVASICDGDTSMLSSTATFATVCDAITITTDNPWTEDFENYSGSGVQQFICWERPITEVVDNGTAPFVYCNYGQAAHSGTNTAEMKGTANMLALPEFTNDISELRVSFWATGYSYTNTNVEVGYITDVTDPSTFVAVANAGTPGPRGGSNGGNGNYMGPFGFSGISASGARIALRYTGPGSSSGWNVDDFVVEIAPDCQSPVKTSVTASNIGGHVATISWVDNDESHVAWTVYYKATAGEDWNTEPATDTFAILGGLDPLTQYDVYVVTDCGTTIDNPDATHTIHFTTTVACPAPTNITVTPGMTEAIVSWEGTADSYIVTYGENTITVSENTATLTDLTSSTNYTVSITADCGDDGSSTAATASFSTAACEISDQCSYTFNLQDSYGDGWNGASISVMQDGIAIASLTIPSGQSSANYEVALCDNTNIALVWNSGSYDGECSFTVTEPFGETIYTASGLSGASGTLTSFTAHCVAPTCLKPASITVSNISINSAEVSWVSAGSETAWNLEYKESSVDDWTVIHVTTNSYTLTGLTALTVYNVRVQADCGDGDLSEYKETSFNTSSCDVADQCIYTFILNDSYGDGWNYAFLTVKQNNVEISVLEAEHHGGGNVPSTDTVTLSLCDGVSTSLEWTSGNYDSEAGFSLIGPDGTELYSITGMSYYTTYTFTTDCSGSGPVITNPTVTTNAASGATQTTATLNATISNPDNVAISAKGFEWKATMGGTYAPVTVTGDNFSYNLTNLTPNTSYTFKAFITYNGTTVYGDEKTFNTLPEDVQPCEVPTGLVASNITKESFTVTWDNHDGVSSWNVQYRPLNGQLSSAVTYTNHYDFTDLTAETVYQVQVQANCGDGNLSEWTGIYEVTTLVDGIENYLINRISLYPNPAKEYVDIRVDENVNVKGMEVYDVYGKLINTVNVIDNPTRISVSGLADGMYFVRVTTEQGVATKTFVKR